MSDAVFSLVPVDRGNAALVGDVFRTAYGDAFPVAYVYQPDALLQEISQGRLAGRCRVQGVYGHGLAVDAHGCIYVAEMLPDCLTRLRPV